MNAGDLIKGALVSGESLTSPEYAKRIGVTAETVRNWCDKLVALGLVEKRKKGKTTHYSACNIPGLMCWVVPNSVNMPAGKTHTTAPLYEVWGIRLAHIELPTFTHRLKGEWA